MKYSSVVLFLLLFTQNTLAGLNEDFPEPMDTAQGFFEMEHMDMTSSDVTFKQSGGGTSAYAIIKYRGAVVGAFIPPNSATEIDGEASAYSLARILGIAHTVQAGRLKKISGAELNRFQQFMKTASWTGVPHQNRMAILKQLESIPLGASFTGVMKFWNHRPFGFSELENTSSPGGGSLRTTHPFSAWINSKMVKPTQREVVRVVGGASAKNTEFELARELSSQLLIDALLGQWDRFSGGNLQVLNDDGVLHFALYDNGGAWGSKSFVRKSLNYVSRFDRNAVKNLLELQAFLKGKQSNYHGVSDVRELRSFLQMDYSNQHWEQFKRNLDAVVQHIVSIPESESKYF